MDTRVKPAYDRYECGEANCHAPNRSYFVSENAVGVLPVTWRKACENAGTLA